MAKKTDTAEKEKEPLKQTNFEKKVGISSDSLRKIFEKPDAERKEGDKVKKLINLLRDRNLDGRRMGLRDWRIHAAIDEAWNAPRRQITPTLIGRIMGRDKRLTAEEILRELTAWGISDSTLFITQKSNEGGKEVERKILNEETFNKVLVPVVKAYTTVRGAKLFNDRNKYPLFTYDPVRTSMESAAIGEIVTEIIQKMAEQYGYAAILRSVILQTLKYGQCLMFPKEAWSFEDDQTEDGTVFTKKEGIRYNLPHPTRCALDPMHRPSTINTDTGCEWALYWNVVRYGDIEDNPLYFNKDKVSYGRTAGWFDDPSLLSRAYFTEVYPCVATPPMPVASNRTNDRETEATLYSTNERDKAVFETHQFVKLKPSEWGLGDYKRTIWLHFIMANDDTVVWAEPIPYTPILWAGYDADENCAVQSSMALECLPWQDLTGNILSQHLLTVKQNAMKVILYDKQQLKENDIQDIAQKSKDATSIHWVGQDYRQNSIAGKDPANMLRPINLGYQDTTQYITTLNTLFSTMERILQMSAQETGTVAGHIQTAEEVRLVSDNVSNRVQFTGTFIDDFSKAWKVQLVTAAQAFLDDDFEVSVQKADPKLVKKLKDDYGFDMGEPFDGKVVVKGKKSKLAVSGWLSSREGNTLRNNPQVATILLQSLQAVVQNEALAQQVGVEWIVETINRAAKLAGAPEDFKVKVSPEASTLAQLQQVQAQLIEAAKAITEGAAQQAAAQVAQEIAPAVAQVNDQLKQAGELAVKANEDNVVQQGIITDQQNQLKQLEEVVLKMNTIIGIAAEQEQQLPPQPEMMPPMV